jgi:hypothetical protein
MAPKIRKPSGKSEPPVPPSLADLEAELDRRQNPSAPTLAEAHIPTMPNALRLRYAGVGRRLHVPVVRGDLRFGFPFLSWDAWMALHHIAQEPLEHNQDGSIPARWLKPLEQRAVPLPTWAGIDDTASRRVSVALHLLLDLKLLSTRKGPSPGNPNLGISTAGTECLKAGRLSFFARTLEYSRLASFDPARDLLTQATDENLRSLCWRMGHEQHEFEGLGRRLTQRVLEVLPPTGSVRMMDMEAAFAPALPHVYVRGTPWLERKIEISSEDFFDRIEAAAATRIMVDTLVFPYFLGLVARGITAKGEVTWSFTDAGRNWQGLPPDPHPNPPRHAKVTPAFDIYFGRVDPTALAEIALYAEPTAQDHGIVGRLARTGVQAAMSWGLSITEIVASLDALVASPLPANVRQTVEDWGRGAQPVRVREGVVLQCPDASSAGSLERLAKGSAERLSDTILLLPDRKTLAGLRRKAGEMGILL